MKVEALNCPNCGAGVASDKTQCEFCKTRLKTVGCPSCLGLMFVGNRFCGHCGGRSVQTASGESGELGECPRCQKQITHLQIGEAALNECLTCSGMWADVETFEKVCADREQQSAVLGFIGKREIAAAPPAKVSYVPCPKCKQLMNRSNFARASGVIIDICKQHGVWFDAGELPKIIEFIQKGGMEISRQREKMEIRDERERLREELRKQAAMDRRFGTGNVWESEESRGIQSFIRTLFD